MFCSPELKIACQADVFEPPRAAKAAAALAMASAAAVDAALPPVPWPSLLPPPLALVPPPTPPLPPSSGRLGSEQSTRSPLACFTCTALQGRCVMLAPRQATGRWQKNGTQAAPGAVGQLAPAQGSCAQRTPGPDLPHGTSPGTALSRSWNSQDPFMFGTARHAGFRHATCLVIVPLCNVTKPDEHSSQLYNLKTAAEHAHTGGTWPG